MLTSDITSAHIQFDREDLGVCLIKDIDMVPFQSNSAPGMSNQVSLNDIRDIHLNPHFKNLVIDGANSSQVNTIPIENTEVRYK